MDSTLTPIIMTRLVNEDSGPLERVLTVASTLISPTLNERQILRALTIQVFAIFGGYLSECQGEGGTMGEGGVTFAHANEVMSRYVVGGRTQSPGLRVHGSYNASHLTIIDAHAVALWAPDGYGVLGDLPFGMAGPRKICAALGRFWVDDDETSVLLIATVSGAKPTNPHFSAAYQQLATTLMAAIQAELVVGGHVKPTVS